MESEKEKLDNLSYRIDGAERKPPTKSDLPPGQRMGVDFVGSIVISGVVGALIDRAFDTSPWGLLGMVFFGFGTGIWAIWRVMQKAEDKENRE